MRQSRGVVLACAARAFREQCAQTRTCVTRQFLHINRKTRETHCIILFEETLNIINPKHMPFSLFLWGEREGLKKKGGRDLLCSLLLLQTRYKKEDYIGRAITPLSFFFVIGTTTTTTTHFTRALSLARRRRRRTHHHHHASCTLLLLLHAFVCM